MWKDRRRTDARKHLLFAVKGQLESLREECVHHLKKLINAWYPAPYYWGGGFWGAFAIGATSAAVYGSIVAANNATYTSYQAQPESPGAKLLSSYNLTQTSCGAPNLVVIYGPNNSVICAYPNNLVSAGNYSVDQQTLTIVSEKT